MRGIWEFLVQNPILFFVLAAWAAGAIGNALKSRNAQQKREQARGARRPADPTQRVDVPGQQRRQPSSTQAPVASPTQRPLAAPTQQPVASPTQRPVGSPTQQPLASPTQPQLARPQQGAGGSREDEIAAEMRRILGLDTAAPPERAPEVMPRIEPVRRAPIRPIERQEPPPVPLAPAMGSRTRDSHIHPHVGESITGRKAAGTGRVGMHDGEWGTLGGRRRDAVVEIARPAERGVDLRDLKRIIIGAEVLGPPLALRAPDQQRMF